MSPRLESFEALDSRRVPTSALLISMLALGVAAAGNLYWPERLPDSFALLWLLALIPPFLLAYYRGWEGAALALAAGMILLVGVEVGGSYLNDRQVRWWIVSGVIVVLITVSLGAGFIAERLHRQTSEALDLAYADPLTGLPNRRILDMFLHQGFAAAQRGTPFCVVLFDIDGFKGYNDTRGHSAGDEALRLVARTLRANTRAMNTSGRQGGDEFLSLLPGAEATGALVFAERVRSDVADTQLAKEHDITVSGGVAFFDPVMQGAKELLDAADRALYAAKSLGGNRIVLNGERGTPDEKPPTRAFLFLDAGGEIREMPGGNETTAARRASSES
ncbi:MAG: GGDEF domain-containing protein [Gemmatimonadota bacterium]